MFLIGLVLLIAGALMTILVFTGLVSVVPGLVSVADSLPLGAWVGIAVIGAVVTMMTRRVKD